MTGHQFLEYIFEFAFSNQYLNSYSPMAAVDLPVLASLEEYLTKERPLDRRVLSIQSHVVSGHVGNKSAVFPLQLHGYEVDDINSVQFSNHTQYSGGALGQRLAHADLEQLFEGLRRNRLDRNYSHVLTGYCGDGTFLRHLASIVRECRQHRPDLRFVCDPVLGDNGKYYVPRELCDIYRSEVLPLADLITPNAFELGELSGISVSSESDCLLAIRALFSAHPNLQQIVCTSGLPPTAAQTMMACFAAEKISPQIDGGKCHFRLFRFDFPLIESTFVGSGDLFSALHLAWMDQTEGNLCAATRATLASMQAVLRRTAERAKARPSFSPNECAARELQLVQSRWDLLRPRAEEINYMELEMPQ